MLNAKVIKTTARTALKNNWSVAIFASLILVAVSFVIAYSSSLILSVFGEYILGADGYNVVKIAIFSVVTLFAILLFLPTFLGTVRWFWALITQGPLSLSEIFYYYSKSSLILRTLCLSCFVIVRVFFVAFFSFLPAIIFYEIGQADILSKFGIEIQKSSISVIPVVILFGLIGFVAFLKISLKYVFSFAISVANEELDPYEAVMLSKKITANSRFSLVICFFAFLPWVLLSAFGVTLVYTAPFIFCSYVVGARILITNYCIDNNLESI